MPSQGTPSGRFQRAIANGNLWAAEAAARELGRLPLGGALALTALIADVAPQRFERAAVRWHGRFVLEVPGLSLAESQLALGAVASLRGGDRSTAGGCSASSVALTAPRTSRWASGCKKLERGARPRAPLSRPPCYLSLSPRTSLRSDQ